MLVQRNLDDIAKQSINIIRRLDDCCEKTLYLVHNKNTNDLIIIDNDHDLTDDTMLVSTMLVTGRTTALDVMRHFEPSLREYMNGN
ncbi:hypothetical protein [Shewanella sp. SE1]|uniref:hypothetical protein n=1 Tax=Shewanella sp. SE1 TaxID=2705014 RepID=UPI00138F2659|nr:hypothetical protein [Shewanella sp. SE1]NDO73058.1 hypothetical protein [Shewanella sp. SE1]